jgi:hypothetical protein
MLETRIDNCSFAVNAVLEIAIRRSKLEIRETSFDECSQIMANVNYVIMGRVLKSDEELFKSPVG